MAEKCENTKRKEYKDMADQVSFKKWHNNMSGPPNSDWGAEERSGDIC